MAWPHARVRARAHTHTADNLAAAAADLDPSRPLDLDPDTSRSRATKWSGLQGLPRGVGPAEPVQVEPVGPAKQRPLERAGAHRKAGKAAGRIRPPAVIRPAGGRLTRRPPRLRTPPSRPPGRSAQSKNGARWARCSGQCRPLPARDECSSLWPARSRASPSCLNGN